ncbi:hypothetical protein [Anabaena sp. CS-542/02]|uniref:hypothetical protein n=1 Tax=Anabaena sp. CS-542/02 TaxID=3021719 RepID=UPI00232E22F5|nr:hypothetical protein [Anabaena sp. CS-542/02]
MEFIDSSKAKRQKLLKYKLSLEYLQQMLHIVNHPITKDLFNRQNYPDRCTPIKANSSELAQII